MKYSALPSSDADEIELKDLATKDDVSVEIFSFSISFLSYLFNYINHIIRFEALNLSNYQKTN
jgi:hypothetical protein